MNQRPNIPTKAFLVSTVKMTVTYEIVKGLFLFLDPLSEFSGLLFSELLPE
jgi:hypothetical protein